MNTTPPGVRARKPRGLTPEQFEKLLACLAPDRAAAAEQYEHMRCALITFFEFRAVAQAEDDADEVLDRVARRLDEGREIFTANPRNYFYAVARNVWRERLASPVSEVGLAGAALSAGQRPLSPLEILEEAEAEQLRAERLRGLESCLQKLAAAERELIVAYYQGSGRDKIQNRQALAQRLGLPIAGLRVRACRLRDKLESCVKRHLRLARR